MRLIEPLLLFVLLCLSFLWVKYTWDNAEKTERQLILELFKKESK